MNMAGVLETLPFGADKVQWTLERACVKEEGLYEPTKKTCLTNSHLWAY